MLLGKKESSLRKTVSLKDIFRVCQNPVRKRKVYKTEVVIQNSATKYYHEFHVRPYKDL